MALSHILAHRIERPDPTKPCTLNLRENAWNKDGRIEECFRELKHSVIKRFSKDYGRFSDDLGNYPFSSWLKELTEEKLSFESFTKKTMQHFKSEVDKIDVELDGFIFFAYETLENDDFLHLFFVQHSTGQYIDSALTINESFYLDTNNINLAIKINITDWQSEDKHLSNNALTLLKWRGSKDISDAFSEFIGFSEKVDLSAETEEFLHTVSDYTKDLPEVAAHYTKKKIVDYCLEQDKMGKPVVIDELSDNLKENPLPKLDDNDDSLPIKLPDFAVFNAERKPQTKPELIPDKTQLRQYVRISGRDNRLSMSFSSSCLGDTIVYDPNSDSLTIKNLPPALKQRLVKHFKNSAKEE